MPMRLNLVSCWSLATPRSKARPPAGMPNSRNSCQQPSGERKNPPHADLHFPGLAVAKHITGCHQNCNLNAPCHKVDCCQSAKHALGTITNSRHTSDLHALPNCSAMPKVDGKHWGPGQEMLQGLQCQSALELGCHDSKLTSMHLLIAEKQLAPRNAVCCSKQRP